MAASQLPRSVNVCIRDASSSDDEAIRSLLDKTQVKCLEDFNVDHFVVAENEETTATVGLGQLKPIDAAGTRFELSTLCVVDPAFQSKGIGTRMTERLLKRAKEKSNGEKDFVALQCFSTKIAFYERFGFKEVHVQDPENDETSDKEQVYIPEAMKRQVIESRNKLRNWLADNDETHPTFEIFSNGKMVCMKLKLNVAENKSETDAGYVEMKECRCLLCGNMFVASSPEDCVAHMETCDAFSRVYPENGQVNPNGVYPNESSTNPFAD